VLLLSPKALLRCGSWSSVTQPEFLTLCVRLTAGVLRRAGDHDPGPDEEGQDPHQPAGAAADRRLHDHQHALHVPRGAPGRHGRAQHE